MPRKRRRRRRKKPSLPWYQRKYTPMEVAQAALKTATYVKSLVNVERKFLDSNISNTTSSTGDIDHVSAIPQGDGQNAREGNSVKATFIGVRVQSFINPSATNTQLRYMLVCDNQTVSDSTPAIDDILESVNTRSFLDGARLGRFTVLLDKTVSLVASSSKGAIHREHNLPLNKHIRFNGTASTDIQKNGLYYLTLSDQPTNTPTVNTSIRLRYVDN